jgi:hypothetical protein
MINHKIMFLRAKTNHPVGCIAIDLDFLKNRGEPKSIYFQVSTLNPNDNFNRKIARQLAIGRLAESPITIPNVDCTSVHNVIRAVMDYILADVTLPKRSRNAAKNWIQTKAR